MAAWLIMAARSNPRLTQSAHWKRGKRMQLTRREVELYAARAGFPVEELDSESVHVLSQNIANSVGGFFDVIQPFAARRKLRRVEATRDHRPRSPLDDPLNAVVRWCDVRGGQGILSGKQVAVKDVISVAGIPLTAGSRILTGFTPEEDAIVVERIVNAGGTIVAVTNMEDMALSGGGETSTYGPIRNPHDLERTASGSSSGSAACLYYEGIDIALGTDQGGSIRLPAAWCGVLGLKPTYGLVPYTGIASLDRTLDHVGPLTRTSENMALAMDAIAGAHPADTRQPANVPELGFTGAVRGARSDMKGIKIGVLKEGCSLPEDGKEGRQETMAAFNQAMTRFRDLSAEAVPISIPEHVAGDTIMFAALVEGIAATLYSHGEGYHHEGEYRPDISEAFARGLKSYGGEAPLNLVALTVVGEKLRDKYGSSLYGRAHNAFSLVRQAYDQALDQVDYIAMPTATHYAHKVAPDATPVERSLRGWGMLGNTAIHNITGHPALSIPAADHAGIPVGVMLVGKHFRDHELVALARTYEKAFGWFPRAVPSFPGAGPVR